MSLQCHYADIPLLSSSVLSLLSSPLFLPPSSYSFFSSILFHFSPPLVSLPVCLLLCAISVRRVDIVVVVTATLEETKPTTNMKQDEN